jgi:hypothetical protein
MWKLRVHLVFYFFPDLFSDPACPKIAEMLKWTWNGYHIEDVSDRCFTQRVQDCYVQERCASESRSSKLSTYNVVLFKNLPQPESYLACILYVAFVYLKLKSEIEDADEI